MICTMKTGRTVTRTTGIVKTTSILEEQYLKYQLPNTYTEMTYADKMNKTSGQTERMYQIMKAHRKTKNKNTNTL